MARGRPEGDMRLRTVTSHVRRYIEQCQRTTHTAVADALVAEYRAASGGVLTDETLRRRIYDVITVLRAIGYVQKADSALIWIGDVGTNGRCRREAEQALRRVQSKEQTVRYKLHLLLLYNSLIAMNRTIRKPANAIFFPMIVIGSPAWHVEKGGTANLLAVESRVRPTVFSPIDILMCKPFDEDAMEGARRRLPPGRIVDELVPL